VLKNRGTALAAALQGKEVGLITVDIDAMRRTLRTMVEEASALASSFPSPPARWSATTGLGSGPRQKGHHGDPVRWMKR